MEKDLQHRPARLREAVNAGDPNSEQDLVQLLGISRVTAKVLANRGVAAADDAKAFLSPSLREHIPNPSSIKNIEAAASVLLEAIQAKHRITIVCDFDVDGLSSASQLILYLKQLGGKVGYYVPNRFTEGYGLSKKAIDELKKVGTKLLVTVDCGISSHDELVYCRRQGMRSIVIDHHEPHELPAADVIVDPAQPGCPFRDYRLAAAGLVWMLLIVLRAKTLELWPDQESQLPNPKDYLDLAALGTICDMVPLQGPNRVIAHRGVEALRRTKRPGLIALKEAAGVHKNPRLGAGHIGFSLGPRINAAGRLGDASEALELLITDSSTRAQQLAKAVSKQNQKRQQTEEKVRLSCLRVIEAAPRMLKHKAIAIYGADYHLGVIGIVASRLVERFGVPVAVMANGEAEFHDRSRLVVKGSIRSIEGFHVAAALENLKELLVNYGGHAQAGGFSLLPENLEDFKEAFIALADEQISQQQLERTRTVDALVELSEVDFRLGEELDKLAPFGIGNPSPVLLSEAVEIESVTTLGQDHLKLRVSQNSYALPVVAWGFQGNKLLRKGAKVNIAYAVELNSYNGVSSVQLRLKEVWSA